MPLESNKVSLDGHSYQIIAQSQTPAGRRSWKRTKRASQTVDPGVQKTASWRLNGPHGLSREDPAGGLLAVDYTQDMDTLYESLLLPGPKRNPIDLVGIASTQLYHTGLVRRGVTFPFTIAASSAAIGTQAWSNPSNALVDSATYASADGGADITQYLKLTVGAGSRVPAGSPITGIASTVRRYSAGFTDPVIVGTPTLVSTVGTSASITPTTGTAVGDWALVVIKWSLAGTVVTPPAGFTAYESSLGPGVDPLAGLFYKQLDAVTALSFGFDGNNLYSATCVTVRGGNPADFFDVLGAWGNDPNGGGASTDSIAPGVTATGIALLLGFWSSTPAASITAPGGMTKLQGTSAATPQSLSVASQVIAAGATGDKTATMSTALNVSTRRNLLVAIKYPDPAVSVVDDTMKIVVGNAVVGADYAAGGAWPSVATEKDYGGLENTWSYPLTDASINAAGLGIALSADVTGEARVEYADMTVSYLNSEVVANYEARVGAFPVGGAPVGGGTATSVPQTVTNIDEDRGAIFFHGGAFSFQVEPTAMDAVAYHQWEASVRGAAMWRNKGYVGLGSLVPMQRRVTVSDVNATYEDVEFSSDPGYAGSIVVGPDRVWWVDPEDSDESNLRYSLDQLVTRSNPFLVGDPGIPSTGLGTYGRSALAGSEIGAFGFTDLGIPVRVLESLRGQRSPKNGVWITTLWGWTYITTSIGLKATIPGQVENPAGPGADRRYEGPNGRVTAIWPYKDALFAAVLTTAGDTYIYRGEFDDGRYGGDTAKTGKPAWFPFAFLAATESEVIFSTGLRTNPTLLIGEGANASYWTLSVGDRDISDPLYRFHTGTGRWFGTTMMRAANLHKSPRYFTSMFEDCDETNSYQIALSVDGRTYVNIGSAIVASGHKFIYPVSAGVPLDTVSGHFFKPEVICASDDDVTPPKMRGTLDMVYDERPDTIIEHEFVIEAGVIQGGTNGGEIEFARLSALYAAHGHGADSPFEFELPGTSATIYGLVAAVGEMTDLQGDGIQRCTVVVQEWPTSQMDDDDDE